MLLTPVVRNRIIVALAAVFAVWLGSEVASGDYLWPVLFAGGAAALTLTLAQPWRIDVLLLGLALIGYIGGNRGFAQLSLAGNIPLLPAEFVLLVGGTILLVQSAWRKELPLVLDGLNLAILVWMVVGTGRLYFDVRKFGAMALRDYATVYYAAFFFLAQSFGRDPAARRFLLRCALGASLFALVAFPLVDRFPEYLAWIAVRGVPLILYKGDLVGTMLAFAGVYFFVRYEATHRRRQLVASLLLLLGALATNNRASIVGVGVATLWLALARRWRFAVTQVLCGAFGALVILLAAYAADIPWQRTPLYGLYERAASVIDPLGQRTYRSTAAASKGDNNVFRILWWRAVVDETIDQNPYLGVGFGYDLAESFVREYYPDDASGEFTARSPHNVLLTIFARMGAAGFMAFAAVIVFITIRTWRAVRREFDDVTALWCGIWVILVSACFGVVLEGPMGAVVFWSLLGLANAGNTAAETPDPSAAENLREPAPPNQLLRTS